MDVIDVLRVVRAAAELELPGTTQTSKGSVLVRRGAYILEIEHDRYGNQMVRVSVVVPEDDTVELVTIWADGKWEADGPWVDDLPEVLAALKEEIAIEQERRRREEQERIEQQRRRKEELLRKAAEIVKAANRTKS